MVNSMYRIVACATAILATSQVLTLAVDDPVTANDPALTLGLQSGNDTEFQGDLLIPIYPTESGLFFIDPRASATDNSEQEFSLGTGYRQLFEQKGFILGANLFYDRRETERDSRFNQLGAGLEYLGRWIDLRANYYYPLDDEQVVDEQELTMTNTTSYNQVNWNDPYATGNQVLQDGQQYYKTVITETHQRYEQYEEALQGFDAEAGVRLPIKPLEDVAEVKVLAGYYWFEGDRSKDVKGVKGRLEVRALPSLYLDALVYENDDLTGSDYTIGARIRIPFEIDEIAKGHNPFRHSLAGFKPGMKQPQPASRLTDMIMRDFHVRTAVTEPVLVEQTITTAETGQGGGPVQAVLLDNVTFVDGDNTGDEKGTYEQPYSTIQEGVSNAHSPVYVSAAATSYTGTVVLRDGITLWGSGTPVMGSGGKSWGGGAYPQIDGGLYEYGVIMANNTRVTGFHIGTTEDPHTAPETAIAGVYAKNVDNLQLDNLIIENAMNGINIVKDGTATFPDFTVSVSDCTIQNLRSSPLIISASDNGGDYAVSVVDSDFIGCHEAVVLQADNYTRADLLLANCEFVNIVYYWPYPTPVPPFTHALYVSVGGSSSAHAVIDGNRFTANAVNGLIGAHANGVGALAQLDFVNNEAYEAPASKLSFSLGSSSEHGSAVVNVDHNILGSSAGWHGGYNTGISANGEDSAVIFLTHNTVPDNSSDGFRLNITSANGPVSIFGEDNYVAATEANAFPCLYFESVVSGRGLYNLDFGGGSLGSQGRNTFKGGVINLTAVPLSARYNWWNGNDPASVCYGPVDCSNPLPSPPNP